MGFSFELLTNFTHKPTKKKKKCNKQWQFQLSSPAVQFSANIIQRDALIPESLPFQFFRERVQIQVLQPLGGLQDLLQRPGRIGALVIVVFQGVHGHLPRPLVCLRMDPGPVQYLHVRLGTVTQTVGVYFDKTRTVDKHLEQKPNCFFFSLFFFKNH